MTHVVTGKCIKCKFTTCVTVCPVNCFHDGANMVVINPDKCIDCGVCVSECPIGAIVPDDKSTEDFLLLNSKYAKLWPEILEERPPLKNAELFANEENKYDKYFDPNRYEPDNINI